METSGLGLRPPPGLRHDSRLRRMTAVDQIAAGDVTNRRIIAVTYDELDI
jgi:hypothetical protein